MIKGIETAALGMNAQTLKQNVIANNLANADTTGFKREMMIFEGKRTSSPTITSTCPTCSSSDETCCGTKDGENFAILDALYTRRSPVISESYTVFENGGLKPTQNPFDMAIEGDAFFTVQTPMGVRYTRAGSFTADAEGILVTQHGYQVMGTNGPINVNGKNLAVGTDGTVSVDGEIRGQLQLVSFSDKRQLIKNGDTLFRTTESTEQVPSQSSVVQGFLETSNVNSIREMVEMISAYRTYESNQRSITAQDTTLGLAVNDVGQA